MDKTYLEKKLVNFIKLTFIVLKHLISYIRYLTIINTPLNIEVALTSQKPTEIII